MLLQRDVILPGLCCVYRGDMRAVCRAAYLCYACSFDGEAPTPVQLPAISA
jgi:hypothetical protein